MDGGGGYFPLSWGSGVKSVQLAQPVYSPHGVKGMQFETARSVLSSIMTASSHFIGFTGGAVDNVRIVFPKPLAAVIGYRVVGVHNGAFVNPGTESLMSVHCQDLARESMGGVGTTGTTTQFQSDVIGVLNIQANILSSLDQECIEHYLRQPKDFPELYFTLRLQPSGATYNPGAMGGGTANLHLIIYSLPNPGDV